MQINIFKDFKKWLDRKIDICIEINQMKLKNKDFFLNRLIKQIYLSKNNIILF